MCIWKRCSCWSCFWATSDSKLWEPRNTYKIKRWIFWQDGKLYKTHHSVLLSSNLNRFWPCFFPSEQSECLSFPSLALSNQILTQPLTDRRIISPQKYGKLISHLGKETEAVPFYRLALGSDSRRKGPLIFLEPAQESMDGQRVLIVLVLFCNCALML